MMDWLTNYLPDGSDLYWAILCTALVLVIVWQYAHAHGLKAMIANHAPEGKAIVQADSIEPRIIPSTIPPPWKGTP